MATKLKDLSVIKVDFVDAGANPRANIMLLKRAPKGGENVEQEGKFQQILSAVAKKLGIGEDGKEIVTHKVADKVKQEADNMGIDKSKLNAEVVAYIEELEKKVAPEERMVNKSEPDNNTSNIEDIVKGLTPTLQALVAKLNEQTDKAEELEMLEVAKKYEILGEKPEELAKVLKSTKAQSEEAYTYIIKALDSGLAALQKAGLFTEIGKRGTGEPGNEQDRVEQLATEILKTKPELTVFEARDLVFQQHPELVDGYK